MARTAQYAIVADGTVGPSLREERDMWERMYYAAIEDAALQRVRADRAERRLGLALRRLARLNAR